MGAQYFGPPLFFDEFLTCGPDGLCKKEASQWSLGMTSLDSAGPVPDPQVSRPRRAYSCGPRRCGKNSVNPFSDNRVPFCALVCSNRLSSNADGFRVSAYAGLYKIDDEIASGHLVSNTSRSNGILALISQITTGF